MFSLVISKNTLYTMHHLMRGNIMKKFVIAALVASTFGLTANAQEGVQLYGKLRVFGENVKVENFGSENHLFSDQSRIGLRGSENLNHGLKASFVVETGVEVDSPGVTRLGDRTALLGISNNVMGLAVGRDRNSVGAALDKFNPFGDSLVSSTRSLHVMQGTRLDNAVFLTAAPVKGLRLAVQHAFAEGAAHSTTAGGVEVDFMGATVSVSRFDNKDSLVSTVFAANYNLVKTGTGLFAVYSDDEVLGVKNKGMSVGVSQKLLPNLTGQAMLGKKETAGNTSLKAYNFGLTYSLSKRTAAHARFVKEDADAAGLDVTRLALGLEHTF